MRRRIVLLLVIPIACVLQALGCLVAHNMAASAAQDVYVAQFRDVTRFLPTVALALSSGEVSGLRSELDRYGEVYGNGAAVIARDGTVWLSNAPFAEDGGTGIAAAVDATDPRVSTALVGRHSVPIGFRWPWNTAPVVVAEPVISAGDVTTVMVTVSDGAALANRIWWRWLALEIGVLAAIAAAALVADRLARWAVRPTRDLANALTDVGEGHLGARVGPSSGPPELRRVVTEFNKMAARVESAIDHQRAFVANASHELRNPLHALLLRVDEMGMSLPSDALPQYEAAREEGLRMARLLDALLMLARSEDAAFVTGPIDLAEVATQRVAALEATAAAQDVKLILVAPEPVWADADDLAMQSALDAVIDNAVKFSPAGMAVEVEARAAGAEAVLTVRDHGPGLREHEYALATNRFWRSPVHQNKPGSGIGLAIASTFTKVCGGTLTLTPARGGGLLVEMRLPASIEDPV